MNRENPFPFPECTSVDRLFAAVCLLAGYWFASILTQKAGWEAALSAFTVFYAAVALLYLYGKKVCPSGESWFWLAVLLAIGLPFGCWSILHFLQAVALILTAAYWTLAASGRLLAGNRTSQWVFFDLWNALAVVPFHNFCQFRVLKESVWWEKRRNRRANAAWAVLLGFAITIPILAIILPLLSSADAGFQTLVRGWMDRILTGRVADYVYTHLPILLLRVFLAIPVSECLFGLLFGGIHGRNTDRIRVDALQETGKRIRKAPDVAVCTSLTIVCLVYLLFIGVQGRYLFAAFAGTLPQGFTYAEYARRGFFELCRIGAWNLAFLGGAGLFSRTGSREHRGLGALAALLSALTLLLLATALGKLWMYISVYGLTVNRVLPFMFLLWLALVFASAILRQKKAFPMARFCVMAGAVMFCLLCVFPIERWVEWYNAWARMRGYI